MLRARSSLAFTATTAAVFLACARTPPRIELRGVVTNADGLPVAGAVVAANRPGERGGERIVATGADGSYVFTLEKDGSFALTATSDAGTAAYRPPERFAGSRSQVTLALGDADQGFAVTGRVIAAAALPSAVTVSAARLSDVAGDVFVTRVDASGRYRLRLPRALARGYTLEARAEGSIGVPVSIRELREQTADLDLYVPSPLPSEVVDWVRQSAIPLLTVEAGHGFEDLAALDRLVGDARIVGLGEATHGTREFFQLKHRLLEYLVVKKGFRAIALEASRPEARRLNDYVLQGRGTAGEALAGLHYWTWDTEEVLAMVEWMRTYNASVKDDAKVEFLGFDMEYTAVAETNVRAYLDEVDPTFARSRPAGLAIFAGANADEAWAKLPPEERTALRGAADATVLRLDGQREAYVKATTRDRWLKAREDARVIAQWAEVHARDTKPGDFDFNLRDIAMTENVDEILEQGGPREKIVLWAHNGHVGLESPPLVTMGELLRKKHGGKYVGIGLLFGQGGFQARGAPSSPRGGALQDFELGLPPESDATTPMSRAGHRLAVLDLRQLPGGVVHDWFAAPHPVRDIGVRFSDETSATSLQVLARRYDAVAFVAKTTAARSTPTGRRGP